MRPTVVLNVVGLSSRHLGEHTPHLEALRARGSECRIRPQLPAVTCTAQSTYLTGAPPSDHGIVGNGWYFRDLSEVWLWRQSNRLVRGEKLWDVARRRDPGFTVAKLFWWYNMYADVDWSVTPRPMYPADGRKIPDIHTFPGALRDELTDRLGPFPLFNFWGPLAGLASSRWIVDCAKHVFETRHPTLTLVYLPHLDYDLQRFGPSDPRVLPQLQAIDGLCGELIELADGAGARVVVLSEYGITEVSGPIHINRALRRAGLIEVRHELGTERLDAGASAAFAVSDHQIAHVYVRDAARIPEVTQLLEDLDGVERVLGDEGKRAEGLDHPRAGELIALSAPDRWFTYYYWLDDAVAPDYARCVDIHRKPGYDPVELFLDPALRAPKLQVGWRLAKKKLGFRTMMDVIGLNADLVRGSHGARPVHASDAPLLISSVSGSGLLDEEEIDATDVRDRLLAHIFA